MITELWKNVVGYENLYLVSNYGNIMSLNYNCTGQSKLLKPALRGNYLAVELFKDKVGVIFSVHRLVAEAFIPNPNNYPEVNHIDESKENNSMYNLEWCTRLYNINYGSRTKKSIIAQSKKVIRIDEHGVIYNYDSVNSTKEFGFIPQAVSECCRGKRKFHKRSRWQFA